MHLTALVNDILSTLARPMLGLFQTDTSGSSSPVSTNVFNTHERKMLHTSTGRVAFPFAGTSAKFPSIRDLHVIDSVRGCENGSRFFTSSLCFTAIYSLPTTRTLCTPHGAIFASF